MNGTTGQLTSSETTSTETTGTETTVTPEGFVNADGTLIEGWQGRLANENLRTDETLKKFAAQKGVTFETLANTIVNLRKQVPMDKVVLPGVNATEDELNEFYAKLGRPATLEDYVVEKPEDLPDEYWNAEEVTAAKIIFHKIGLTQAQAKALTEFNNQRTANALKKMAEDNERAKGKMVTALRNKWGTAYDERLHLCNRMISENTTEGEQREEILKHIGNSPFVGDFLANIASKFVEHKIITDIETPSANLEERKKDLMNSDAYKDRNHPDHKETSLAVQRIFAELAKLRIPG